MGSEMCIRDRNHGGGRTGFCDKLAAANDNSSKIHAIWQINSAPLKFISHIKMSIFCQTVFYINICKGSYLSGNLKDNEALIVTKNSTSFMIGSAKRFIRVLVESSSTSVSHEEISSCSDTNSARISGPNSGSSTTFGSGLDLQLSCFLESFPR